MISLVVVNTNYHWFPMILTKNSWIYTWTIERRVVFGAPTHRAFAKLRCSHQLCPGLCATEFGWRDNPPSERGTHTSSAGSFFSREEKGCLT